MERPTWANLIAALMILFGGCGVTQDIKQINTEALTNFSADIAEEISVEFGEDELSEEEAKVLKKMAEFNGQEIQDSSINGENIAAIVKQIAHMPADVIAKMKTHGYIGLGMSILYILTGLVLLFSRKHVLRFVYGTLIISLLFVLYQFIDTRNLEVSPIMQIGLDFNLYAGGALDLILLAALSLVDKSYYKNDPNDGKDYYDAV